MAQHELLIMALTRMRSGICTAGFLTVSDPLTHWRWVRPVKAYGSLLPGDMTTASGRVIQVGDVVTLDLLQPRVAPPHTEDWVTDFVRQRPRFLRQLDGDKRAEFLSTSLDRAPDDVLQRQTRSLCLIQPQAVWASFALDRYSAKYEVRLGFRLGAIDYPSPQPDRGMTVTDLRWATLGRHWLAQERSHQLYLDPAALRQRLQAEAIYLSIGLSRPFQGTHWPLVIGVYPVPDYELAPNASNMHLVDAVVG